MTQNKKDVSRQLRMISLLSVALAATIFGAGCNKNNGSSSSGTVIRSAAFTAPSSRFEPYKDEWGNTGMVEVVSPASVFSTVNGLSFCVTQLKLEAEGEAGDLMEAPLGLIDLGDGSVSKDWGNVDFPAGTQLKKLHVEVHRDPEICGVQYSVQLNGSEIQQDVEMTFTFTNQVQPGDAINLSMSNIANAFIAAYDAGNFSDGNITSYIESIEDVASE